MYQTQTSAPGQTAAMRPATEAPGSLRSHANTIAAQANELACRLRTIHERLFGSQPEPGPSSPSASASPHMASMLFDIQSSINAAIAWTDKIEANLGA